MTVNLTISAVQNVDRTGALSESWAGVARSVAQFGTTLVETYERKLIPRLQEASSREHVGCPRC